MRKRKEIEYDLGLWAEKDSDQEYAFAEWRLILETLLDIRELLVEQQERTWGKPGTGGQHFLSELNPDA